MQRHPRSTQVISLLFPVFYRSAEGSFGHTIYSTIARPPNNLQLTCGLRLLGSPGFAARGEANSSYSTRNPRDSRGQHAPTTSPSTSTPSSTNSRRAPRSARCMCSAARPASAPPSPARSRGCSSCSRGCARRTSRRSGLASAPRSSRRSTWEAWTSCSDESAMGAG